MTDRIAFSIFGVDVAWYGLLIVMGMALGCLTGALREKRLGLPKDTAVDLTLIGVPAAVIGARIYYVIFAWESYAGGPFWKVFAIWEGGLAIYGGLIAALLSGVIYAKVRKLNFWSLTDLAAPGFAIGQAIGRWGNYVNQEAYGVVIQDPSLRFFPLAVNIAGEWHAATFFYESVWCFFIFIFLLVMEKKGKLRRPGDGFSWYLLLYALERAVVEGLRTDSLYIGGLRVSQVLSVAVAVGVVIYWIGRKRVTSPKG